MHVQWPIASAEAPADAGEAPLLPLALHEHVELVLTSDALRAFAATRAAQMLTHGHTAEADLEHPIGTLAMEAKARLNALTEIVGGYNGRMNLPAERREQCLRYIEIAGGLLIALWDRCQTEIPE